MCEIRIKQQMHFEYQEIKKYYRNDEMAFVISIIFSYVHYILEYIMVLNQSWIETTIKLD